MVLLVNIIFQIIVWFSVKENHLLFPAHHRIFIITAEGCSHTHFNLFVFLPKKVCKTKSSHIGNKSKRANRVVLKTKFGNEDGTCFPSGGLIAKLNQGQICNTTIFLWWCNKLFLNTILNYHGNNFGKLLQDL